MARKKPDGMKKQKLTLTCKPETITFLNTYCNTYGVSISQLVDKMAYDLKIQEEKAQAKAKRKRKIEQQDILPGQMEITDIQ